MRGHETVSGAYTQGVKPVQVQVCAGNCLGYFPGRLWQEQPSGQGGKGVAAMRGNYDRGCCYADRIWFRTVGLAPGTKLADSGSKMRPSRVTT